MSCRTGRTLCNPLGFAIVEGDCSSSRWIPETQPRGKISSGDGLKKIRER